MQERQIIGRVQRVGQDFLADLQADADATGTTDGAPSSPICLNPHLMNYFSSSPTSTTLVRRLAAYTPAPAPLGQFVHECLYSFAVGTRSLIIRTNTIAAQPGVSGPLHSPSRRVFAAMNTNTYVC